MTEIKQQIAVIKAEAEVELNRMYANTTAKEVAGKAIGENGLFYITLIITLGVGASIILDGEKIAAVMGLLGAALTALISMMNGIAGANPKQEKPEFEVIKSLIERLDKLDQPMRVDVQGDKVTVSKGDDIITKV
jgi:uncharacterized membrane protein